MKRLLFALGIIIIIGGVVAFGIFFGGSRIGKDDAPGTTPSETGTPPGFTPPVGGGLPAGPTTPGTPGGATAGGTLSGAKPTLNAVSQSPARDFFVESDGGVIIVQPDGQIIKTVRGADSNLNATAIANLIRTAFSATGRKLLAFFGNPASPQVSVFDTSARSWQPLAASIEAASWSPSGERIIYLLPQNDRYALTTLDLGNPKAKPQEIMKLRFEGAVPQWTRNDEVLLAERPSALVDGSLWSLDIKNKTVSPIIADRRGLVFNWNASSVQGLVFTSGGINRGGSFGLLQKEGNALRNFSFLTIPSKCSFSEGPAGGAAETRPTVSGHRYLICAIPRDQAELRNRTLPDDYLKRALFTSDDFYQINLDNGSLLLLFADDSRDIDADKVTLVGKRVYFINRLDQKLYVLSFGV